MQRSFPIIFTILFSISPIIAMEQSDNHAIAHQEWRRVDQSAAQLRTSVFDRVPACISGYLYGLPQFFSVKQQLHTYGIPLEDNQGYKPLDQAVHDEIVMLLKEVSIDSSQICITQLNPDKSQNTPGFIVTNGGIFIDQAWWCSIDREESKAQEIKQFFIALMAEQLQNGQYRKQLATKMIVDGVIVSMVIGVVTYTVAPSVCSWMADTVPGTSWLESMSTGIATTANQTCDQFYSPSLCIMAGKTAWSSLLAPGVGPCVHALLTEPVACYLAQQSCSKALESIVNRQALAQYCKQLKATGKSNDQYDQLIHAVEQSDVQGDVYDNYQEIEE